MKHLILISLLALYGNFAALGLNFSQHGLTPSTTTVPPAPTPSGPCLDQQSSLGKLLPALCQWASQQESRALHHGVALNAEQMADARAIGLEHPERVRLVRVEQVPVPTDPLLAPVAHAMIAAKTIGLTFRYGIYIQQENWGDRRLLAHELTHTRQYEQRGDIEAFLRQYLAECLSPPYYAHSPLELEAEQVATALVSPVAKEMVASKGARPR